MSGVRSSDLRRRQAGRSRRDDSLWFVGYGLLAVVRLLVCWQGLARCGSFAAVWLWHEVELSWRVWSHVGVGDGSISQCTTRPLARLHVDRALRARGETGAQTHLWG